MATFGTHLRLTASRDERDTVREFYRAGLRAAQSTPMPDLDVFRLPDGFQIGIYFLPREQALGPAEAEKAAWLEFVVDDAEAAADELVALGASTVDYEDKSHRYLRAPGGQIFRLAVAR
ncbi:MAG TPA: VOC family protein [Kofleriaceae bacterium]|nr:VOC family protein [Kofleriaceae bacterium]